ncbi:cytochrome P450 CYP44-like 3 [Homarus americanus]|uniref:Cytochrome P450 CYP44-like 3 n=1 Tax=Homarus americanus TaxID=6706 RepID=A0A8J5JAT9_HOMAM|nr:cytochrome P450 CYP44-like 3 [Homarus americanus]
MSLTRCYALGQRRLVAWENLSVYKANFCVGKHHNVRSINTVKSHISAQSFETTKPFSAIPGPISLPVLGTLLPYKIGTKRVQTYHQDVCSLYHKYGPVVREVFSSGTVIHVFDLADIRAVYESDGRTPHVPPLQETTKAYRELKHLSPGLGNINGEKWYKLRNAVQQMMLRPQEVSHYYPLQDDVAKKAVERLALEADDQGFIPQLHFFITKWIMEWMCCFEKSLGCLSGGAKEDLAQKMVEADIEIFKLSAELRFSLQLYRYYKTPKYSRLLDYSDFFYGVTLKFISDTVDEIKALVAEKKLKAGQFNFLTYLMSRKELSEDDIDAITFIQERLYQEIKAHVKPDAPITPQTINKLHYLRAFVKEVFRFYPIGEAVQRFLQKDLVLSGYHVPAGTRVELSSYVWLQSSDYFKDPTTLSPERWLRDSAKHASVDPYLHIPFSIGTRMSEICNTGFILWPVSIVAEISACGNRQITTSTGMEHFAKTKVFTTSTYSIYSQEVRTSVTCVSSRVQLAQFYLIQ